jgi:hypothetical protein
MRRKQGTARARLRQDVLRRYPRDRRVPEGGGHPGSGAGHRPPEGTRGQRRFWGYPVVESYPLQTRALAVEIPEPSWPYDEGCEGDIKNRYVWLGRGMPIVHFVP